MGLDDVWHLPGQGPHCSISTALCWGLASKGLAPSLPSLLSTSCAGDSLQLKCPQATPKEGPGWGRGRVLCCHGSYPRSMARVSPVRQSHSPSPTALGGGVHRGEVPAEAETGTARRQDRRAEAATPGGGPAGAEPCWLLHFRQEIKKHKLLPLSCFVPTCPRKRIQACCLESAALANTWTRTWPRSRDPRLGVLSVMYRRRPDCPRRGSTAIVWDSGEARGKLRGLRKCMQRGV